MPLTVKFIGAFRHISGTKQLALDFKEGSSVEDVIDSMSEQIPQLKNTFCDQELNSAPSNSLILVNGREISVLNGYQTKLSDGDEIVFVPVVHGG